MLNRDRNFKVERASQETIYNLVIFSILYDS